ncbi:MAG: YbaB/EbfC family nucleoid-associated protein [Proteobacteria bacterium]|nr:YbaB/EbfC family nucleoid-associated protein [Pseudomonadota bacterium]MBU1140633.1 YbaB/EbfC family nucleoid-associated protein [Pseudomonadota bacterium]MBU1233137.1 YbaB/EbfC family nucleoid-associated protein [Pseudomonadota bacterium]MBU1419838.1 YbaB/EbfC family nucleoid-associated protein [Pseudomonadota bacterium]MBU1454639.1 YbaB/EbfC family nucleoid-associated protein [Pseudomonadota bacterium]
MDMNSLMQHAQQMQKKMATLQEELGQKTETGSAGGGMVTVTASGRSEILSIEIEQSIISNNDREMLQDLIVAATNDALRKVKDMGKAEMAKLTGGLNVPGLSNIFS